MLFLGLARPSKHSNLGLSNCHCRYTVEGTITEGDYDYLASVSIGGQNVNLLLDTATSLL